MPAHFDRQFAEVVLGASAPCVSIVQGLGGAGSAGGPDACARALIDLAAARTGGAPPSLDGAEAELAELRDRARSAGGRAVALYRWPRGSAGLVLETEVDDAVAIGDRPYVLPAAPTLSSRWTGHVLLLEGEDIALHRWLDGELVRVPLDLPGRYPRVSPARTVDDVVVAATGSSGALVLIGTSAEVARYQNATRHPWTLALPLGRPTTLDLEEMRHAVDGVAQASRANAPARALAHYEAMRAVGRTVTEPDEVRRRAGSGLVEALLVGVAPGARGRPDPITVWDRPDLEEVNDVLVDACRCGAVVTYVADGRLGVPFAAVLRAEPRQIR